MSSTPSTPSKVIMPETPGITPYIDENGKTDAETYLEGIYDGSIVACRHMRRFAEIMLPRITDGYKNWHYDVNKALRPVKFIEKFCRIPASKNAGKPFLLYPYERMPIELTFGFVDNDDGYRQIRQVLIEWARKNGKTSLLAALNLYMLTSDGGYGNECYNGSCSESQARLCYGATDAMRRMSPDLNKRIRRGMVQKRGVSGLNYAKTDSFLCTVSSAAGRLDGLSTSWAVLDEIGASTDNGALLSILEESTSARPEPIIWCITTENYVRNSTFDERKEYSHKWLAGTVEDDRFLPILYTLDSREEIFDERAWPKANPGLPYGVKDINYLRDRVNMAKQSTSRMPSLLTKEFNLVSGEYSSFLDIETECVNRTTIDFNIEQEVYYGLAGFDLASKDDLCCCVCRFFRPNDSNIYEMAKFWIPSEKVNMMTDGNQKDNVPYLQWASQGWVEIVEGDRVNNYVIIDYLRELVDMGIYPFAVGYDPWHVDDSLTRDLERLIGASRAVPVPQTAKVISPLMKEHKLDLHARRVICPNPCLHHCRANVQAREDLGGNLFPLKKGLSSKRKIDGFMAELFCLQVYHKFEAEYMSAIGWETYEKDMAALRSGSEPD